MTDTARFVDDIQYAAPRTFENLTLLPLLLRHGRDRGYLTRVGPGPVPRGPREPMRGRRRHRRGSALPRGSPGSLRRVPARR